MVLIERHPNFAITLLDCGANPNTEYRSKSISSNERESLLLHACQFGRIEAITKILEMSPSSIKYSNHLGYTALVKAIDYCIDSKSTKKSSPENYQRGLYIINLLFEKGETLQIYKHFNISALHLASYADTAEVLQVLIDQARKQGVLKDLVDLQSSDRGYSPVIMALYYADYRAADLLLECNPDLSLRSKDRKKALLLAAENLFLSRSEEIETINEEELFYRISVFNKVLRNTPRVNRETKEELFSIIRSSCQDQEILSKIFTEIDSILEIRKKTKEPAPDSSDQIRLQERERYIRNLPDPIKELFQANITSFEAA